MKSSSNCLNKLAGSSVESNCRNAPEAVIGVAFDAGSAGLMKALPSDPGGLGLMGGRGERRAAGGGKSDMSMSLPMSESSAFARRRSARSLSVGLRREFLRLRLCGLTPV